MSVLCSRFFVKVPPPAEIYTLSLHDALPISVRRVLPRRRPRDRRPPGSHGVAGNQPLRRTRSEEHTSELQSLRHLVCRLLLEKKKTNKIAALVNKERQQHNAQHGRDALRPPR